MQFFLRQSEIILGKLLFFAHILLPPYSEAIHNSINIMVALRLNRQGTKDRPYYKIVAVDNRKRRDGRFIEQVGTYNPMIEGLNYKLDLEKADKWLKNGAQPTTTVKSIIKKARKAELEA